MENQERTNSSTLCGLKTDLDLLLECLKYQMDCPETQKQALVTIYSICQQNCEASDYFREIGGLDFIKGLIKLTNASILREAALFTLGALAESSVYCQQSLCTVELLSDIALSLAQKDASLILKRMDVYMILVLVSHNKIGQALARTTGCIDILLNLFRTSFPMLDKQCIYENIGHYYELWSSIGSTLCACVNNPQNEVNQKVCTTAFPFANECLQRCTRQEIIRPICAFIGLTVANNSYAQIYFCEVGGLDTLAQTVANLADESLLHHTNTELAISVIKTLDSCISENSSLASHLSEYSIIPKLVALLSQKDLDVRSQLGVILAIGHCIDGCEVHQYQLLKSNGLPLMIQIVAESQDEEQRKAATFVLQCCQVITEKLSNNLTANCCFKDDTVTSNPKDISLKNHWKFAEEFLHRIEKLEKQQELSSNIKDMNVQQTATAPSSFVHPNFQSCDSSLTGMNQRMEEGEGVSMKDYRELQLLDKSGTISAKTNELKRCGKNLNFTPAKRKLDIHQRITGCKEEDSIIPTFISSCSGAEENKNQYQDQQLMKKVRRQIFMEDNVPQEEIGENNNASLLATMEVDQINFDVKARQAQGQKQDMSKETACNKGPQDIFNSKDRLGFPETRQQHGTNSWFLTCRKAVNPPVTVPEPTVPRTDTSKEKQETTDKQDYEQRCVIICDEQNLFERPPPIRGKRNKQKNVDPLILCSDLIDYEINSDLTCSVSSVSVGQDFRCSGCLTVAASLNSRNFSKILKSCPNKCDRHKVIQECEERYKKELKKTLASDIDKLDKKIILTPIKRNTSCIMDFQTQQTDTVNLAKTSMKKDNVKNQKFWPQDRRNLYTPQVCNKTTFRDHVYSFDDGKHSDTCKYAVGTRQMRKRRQRQDFTENEIGYLRDGVLKMGYHWNSILWSYPFQKGRTNVDLAHKYRNLQVPSDRTGVQISHYL
ncbi:telomere repeats-binding bouquet formation protein 1 isoform X2 [Narcine bancroftii]|uniref:telomere repeats-binding bouquet formation protein 1 isoform X2 n=1 Tax=Narcine bancroftii TaxID=1343680 RepID=UPI003831F419